MRVKEQRIEATRGSMYIAVVYSVIDAVEASYDETFDLLEVGVPSYLLSPGEVLSRLEEGMVEVEVSLPGVDDVIGEYELSGGSSVRVVSKSDCACDSMLSSLYSLAPAKAIQADSSVIREGARRTAESGIEYIYLYIDDGHLAILEGEHGRVTLPFVKAVMSVHTHPRGPCGLSLADVQSGLDLLAEGGLAEASALSGCAFMMYREGLVIEDDYIVLRSLRGKKNAPFIPGRIPLRSIKFQVVYY